MQFEQFVLSHEPAIRLVFFVATFSLVALWELLAPRRALTVSRALRWSSNLGLVVLNTVLLRLLFPLAAVGVSAFTATSGWGVLNHFQVSLWLALPLAVIALSMLIKVATITVLGPPVVAVVIFEVLLNAAALFNHGNIRLHAGLDRMLRWVIVTPDMHRVHHSMEEDETNSNFGFNLPWWDRLFGTYRAQPRAGQVGMTIGIHGHTDPLEVERLDGMRLMPFKGENIDTQGYSINRRTWSEN